MNQDCHSWIEHKAAKAVRADAKDGLFVAIRRIKVLNWGRKCDHQNLVVPSTLNLEMIWLKTMDVVKIDLHCVANSALNQGLLQPETLLKMNFNVKSTGSVNQLLENQGF